MAYGVGDLQAQNVMVEGVVVGVADEVSEVDVDLDSQRWLGGFGAQYYVEVGEGAIVLGNLTEDGEILQGRSPPSHMHPLAPRAGHAVMKDLDVWFNAHKSRCGAGGTSRMLNIVLFDGVAVFILLIVVWEMRRRLTLRSRGVEISAKCFDRDWRGAGGPQFLLSYTTPDGIKRTHRADEGHVPAGTREGDSVTVLYDPVSPARAETALASRKPFWKHYDMAGLLGVSLIAVLLAHIT
ncbi:DUF3592 domain-containing protein [Streptomyces sp. NPDC055607]